MEKVKLPNAAGKFYPGRKNDILAQFRLFERQRVYEYASRAVIVPHAGYVYSGELAYRGFQHLDKSAKNIFIFAPSHHVSIQGTGVLSSFDKWQTPLGEIEVNQEINRELEKHFGCHFLDEAFENEHAVEVQVPFVQYFYTPEGGFTTESLGDAGEAATEDATVVGNDVRIVPILTGFDVEAVEKIISHFWNNPENAFVISSDLSHFKP
ncbi:MAG: AmmeMemoRadiSam system protein B, partial [Desulfuromonadales bacterium]|nr:AmmeMemoRadiSam system protein B [Desulfuromonadales bacterium]